MIMGHFAQLLMMYELRYSWLCTNDGKNLYAKQLVNTKFVMNNRQKDKILE